MHVRKNTLSFTWPEKDYFFFYIYDVIVKRKKENAPLFTAFVFTCIFIFSICTHVRAQGLGHGVCAAGVGFRDQGSIRLGL